MNPDERLSADATRVDLWFLFTDGRAGDRLPAQACRALLTPDERDKEQRFHFARDRERYLLTRTLVRQVLSRYAPVAPHDWRFAPNAYGRPLLACAPPGTQGLEFNLSHTDGLIVLAVTAGRAIGIDVEALTRTAPLEVADRFFAPAEVADLRAQPAAARPRRFFDFWTLKESYIKARSMGLSLPLDQFGFTLDADGPGLALHSAPCCADEAARWRFWQLQPGPGHLVALCVEAGAAAPVLASRWCFPFFGEGRFEPLVLRRSGPH